MIFGIIICLLILLVLGQYVIKTAIDTSKKYEAYERDFGGVEGN
ncbi:hypothetical protein ABIE27_000148 [Paenibacillus sp. 4624]|jgi:hypothetical protein|nr:hypothetical protein [Paenibacillus amylolyticus]